MGHTANLCINIYSMYIDSESIPFPHTPSVPTTRSFPPEPLEVVDNASSSKHEKAHSKRFLNLSANSFFPP